MNLVFFNENAVLISDNQSAIYINKNLMFHDRTNIMFHDSAKQNDAK